MEAASSALREAEPDPDISHTVDVTTVRLLCAAGAATTALTAVSVYLQPPPSAAAINHLLVAGCTLLSMLLGLACWKAHRLPLRALMLFLAWLIAAFITVVAVGEGQGLHSLDLGYLGLLVCMVTVLVGRRRGLVLASICAAFVCGLSMAQSHGLLGPDAQSAPRQGHALLTQLLTLASGLTLGLVIGNAAARAARRVTAREQRFGALLDLAADHYWELDAQLRIARTGDARLHATDSALPYEAGRRPWAAGHSFRDTDQRQSHLGDLAARRPFHDLRLAQVDEQGRRRERSYSGRPRFDSHGRFFGYWVVDRDVTAEAEARAAIVASEARYRELFERSPSALLLHRGGRVIDANPAAAVLFGFAAAPALRDFDLEQLYPDSASRSLLRERVQQLENQPIGGSLPTIDCHMVSQDGRPIIAQEASVRVEAEDGAATLSIYFDVTERVAAQAAMQRSQTMLATLFASSADGMALSEIDSGIYVMVNDSLARMLGYQAREMIGHSSTSLGIWKNRHMRGRLIDALQPSGKVHEMPAMLRTKNGGRISVTISAARIEMDGQAHLVSNVRDVTDAERLRLEHAAVFHSAFVGIALTRDRRFQLANPRFHDIFGWPNGALVGQPGDVVWPDAVAYEEGSRVATAQLSRGLPVQLERPMRRADGSIFWCSFQAQQVDPGDPLRGGTVWIATDISAQRELDSQLAAARDAAEAANQAKSNFLANTSHEIRTPLNGLLGLARLAARDDVQPAQRSRYLKQLMDSAQTLAVIISDILDLSKIEAGKISVENMPFALHDTLVTLYESQQPLAQAGGLELTLEIDPALPSTVMGDPLRVRQIVGNFISNALKFTAAGHINVGARRVDSQWMRLSVSDTGPGISPEVQQRLFLPFTQGDASTTRRYGGTGLGLSICREMAGLMGGTVGVDSQTGTGSVFWAELPLVLPSPAALAELAGTPAADDAIDSKALAGMRVLVVEDNAVNMMIVLAMLEQWGAQGSEAADGAQALAAVEAASAAGHGFDVVLMDVQMPRMSGYEATRRLREQFDAQTLPIIALTAAALVAEREAAGAAGMNDFLTKPIDAARLFSVLQRHLPR